MHTEGAAGSTLLLEPPYQALQQSWDAPPAVGAILVCDLSAGIPALADVVLAHRAAPWCPVCLVQRGHSLDVRACRAFEPRPSTFAEVALPDGAGKFTPAEVVAGVRRRLAPTPEDLAIYVANRTQRLDLTAMLQSCFEVGTGMPHPGAIPSRSTFRRHLEDFPPLTSRDWAALGHLVIALRDAGLRQIRSRQRLAREHELDPRTLKDRLHRYLGGSLPEALERPGWEWVLEASLRKWHYLDDIGRRVIRAEQQFHVGRTWPGAGL